MREQQRWRVKCANARAVHTRHHLRALSTGKLSQPAMKGGKGVSQLEKLRMSERAFVKQLVHGQKNAHK